MSDEEVEVAEPWDRLFLLYCSHTKWFKLQKTQRKMAAFCAAVILLMAHLRSNHSQKWKLPHNHQTERSLYSAEKKGEENTFH